jgi:hypothetical protein
MRFLNHAGKSRQPSAAHAIPLMYVTGAGMGKPLQPQCFCATKPASGLQSTGVPPSGIRIVSRGEIHPASC